jgi:hypothetical protein
MLWNQTGHFTALDCMEVPTCEPQSSSSAPPAPHSPLVLAESLQS